MQQIQKKIAARFLYLWTYLEGKRKKFDQKEISLLSNNCIAGVIYHSYGMKFRSPTVNIQMSPSDFLKFVNHLNRYRRCELEEDQELDVEKFRKLGGGEIHFPVGRLDDLVLYFQHAKSFEEAREKWIKRFARLNKKNIRVILVDTACTEEEIEQFNALPYPKVFLTKEQGKCALCTGETFLLEPDVAWFEFSNKSRLGKKSCQFFNWSEWLQK